MMMLSETLLDVASFLDYASLVVLRLSNKQLISFVDRYADRLAFRRSFVVSYGISPQTRMYQLRIAEAKAVNTYVVVHTVDLDGTDDERITLAATELQSHIGPHAVHCALIHDLSFSVKLLIDLIPALRYATDIHLGYASGSSPSSQEYIDITSLFERPTSIGLTEIPIEALVVILQSDSALRLEGWAAFAPSAETNIELDAAAEDIIFRSCFNFSNNKQGESREISLVDWNLCWEFLRRLIEAAVDLQHDITIMVSKPSCVAPERLQLQDAFVLTYWRLPLDPASFEEKSVAVLDFLRYGQHRPNPWTKLAYFSKRSEVVVFVNGEVITITNSVSDIAFCSGLADSRP